MTAITGSPIPTGAVAEKLAEVGTWLEGPCWVPSRGAVVFSDIPGNRVWEFDPALDQVRVVEEGAEFTNGRTLDVDGTLVECSHGRRSLQRRDGDVVTPIIDGWNGVRFNSPNDVVVDSAGVMWFSDPAYGIENEVEGHPGEREYGDRWVFRFDPSSDDVTPAVIDVVAPNGLAFSPDESLLYVTDTSGDEGTGHGAQIRVYHVIDGRLCKDGRTFCTISSGAADGIRVDAEGRVWSSAHDGVHVFDPDGTEVGFIAVPEIVSNLCFAPAEHDADGGWSGRDLYVTATTSLYRVRLG